MEEQIIKDVKIWMPPSIQTQTNTTMGMSVLRKIFCHLCLDLYLICFFTILLLLFSFSFFGFWIRWREFGTSIRARRTNYTSISTGYVVESSHQSIACFKTTYKQYFWGGVQTTTTQSHWPVLSNYLLSDLSMYWYSGTIKSTNK